MKLEFKESFAGDLRKRKQEKILLERVQQVINEVDKAGNINDIRN